MTYKRNKRNDISNMNNMKLIYQRGTCFGCRKCLFCAVNLQENSCQCKLARVPNKKNRTSAVRQAYTRIFNPNWEQPKLKFIQDKVIEYNYNLDPKEEFNFSLCGKCHNILVKSSNPKLNISTAATKEQSFTSDLSISREHSSENFVLTPNTTIMNLDDDNNSEEDEDETEFEVSFKIFIKLTDGTSIPAKWYKEIVSSIDEFLVVIHEKIISLLNDNTIEASDYQVAFKGERIAGAGTQLVDAQDFIKFRADYTKMTKRKQDVGIYITMLSKGEMAIKNKRKKKVILI